MKSHLDTTGLTIRWETRVHNNGTARIGGNKLAAARSPVPAAASPIEPNLSGYPSRVRLPDRFSRPPAGRLRGQPPLGVVLDPQSPRHLENHAPHADCVVSPMTGASGCPVSPFSCEPAAPEVMLEVGKCGEGAIFLAHSSLRQPTAMRVGFPPMRHCLVGGIVSA